MELTIDLPLLIALTIGFTEIIKRAGGLTDKVSKRFLPLVALITGVLFATFRLGFNYEAVIMGVFIGLSASGLFSQSKSVLGK